MKKESFYCCSLYKDKDEYYNAAYYDYNEAVKGGMTCIKEFNENLNDENFYFDNSTFDDELINLTIEDEDPRTINKFYIIEFQRPEIPDNLGDLVVDYIDNNPWDDLNCAFEQETLREHLGDEDIEKLNKIIYDFIDSKTNSYSYGLKIKDYEIKVED